MSTLHSYKSRDPQFFYEFITTKLQIQIKESNLIKMNVGHYQNSFEILCKIGSGGFGDVFKVKNKSSNEVYAVKVIDFIAKELTDKHKRDVYKEVEYLKRIDNKYIVHCMDAWREMDVVYIQLEICSQNLTNILEIKPQVFQREPKFPMNSYEYIISCEIFREVLECVQYLHGLSFIHRDFKPDNILISDNSLKGRFVKLCDFGLVTKHDNIIHNKTVNKHTAEVGTDRYIAPEVIFGAKYNHKCDIHSLAVIGGDIFETNVLTDLDNKQPYSLANSQLNGPVAHLKQVLDQMLVRRWNERPECSEVLAKYNEWSIDKNILANDAEFESTLEGVHAIETQIRERDEIALSVGTWILPVQTDFRANHIIHSYADYANYGNHNSIHNNSTRANYGINDRSNINSKYDIKAKSKNFMGRSAILITKYMSGRTVVNTAVERLKETKIPAFTFCYPTFLSMEKFVKKYPNFSDDYRDYQMNYTGGYWRINNQLLIY
ncbi:unnamed protein product [Oppiella nova]|uniref:non-specific serine/threonine protein kinase n=1 Tax=Oppiella nova TaxID=334625 RepID=A0A7R9LUY3_9ACAR|nr:unnamed protein product [Oppiella nova]CAG2166491.1 unnamed protein product [Oppiella nova]